MKKSEFYRNQLEKFKKLKKVCQRPDRIDVIINNYKSELRVLEIQKVL